MNAILRRYLWGMVTVFVIVRVDTGVVLAAENEMSQVANIGDRRQLFVDNRLIERMGKVSLRLHEPVSGGIAINLDKPWEGPANGGISVLRHGDRYLMYYRSMTLKKGDDTGVLCVATSHDGIRWTKPALGLVRRNGRDTNIVATKSGDPLMSTPWFDSRPGVEENEQIKAFYSKPLSGEKHTAYQDPKGPKRLVMWGSTNGFTFRKLLPQPKIVSSLPNCFDGGNTMFWSEAEQAYVLYYRFFDSHRTIARTTSKDFLHWSDSVPMTYGDTPREHLYTNNTVPYFRAPHIYVALSARFMQGRRVVSDTQAQAIGLLKSSRGHSYANDCSEGVLLTSRPGSTRYDRTFLETFVRPGPGAQNWVSRTNYPLTGIFPHGEDRMMFWVSRHYMQKTWHIECMLLRLDGFASANAPYAGGEMVTKPLIFAGKELEINYRTSAAGSVRIEIQDAAGEPISGYALDSCQEIIGDNVAQVVEWKHGTNVSQLVGQKIRLRFLLKDADLYSFKFLRKKLAQENRTDVRAGK